MAPEKTMGAISSDFKGNAHTAIDESPSMTQPKTLKLPPKYVTAYAPRGTGLGAGVNGTSLLPSRFGTIFFFRAMRILYSQRSHPTPDHTNRQTELGEQALFLQGSQVLKLHTFICTDGMSTCGWHILVGEVEGPLPRGTPSFANRKCHHST